jgi:hypothetical protein
MFGLLRAALALDRDLLDLDVPSASLRERLE